MTRPSPIATLYSAQKQDGELLPLFTAAALQGMLANGHNLKDYDRTAKAAVTWGESVLGEYRNHERAR